jgi:hypothetical protein
VPVPADFARTGPIRSWLTNTTEHPTRGGKASDRARRDPRPERSIDFFEPRTLLMNALATAFENRHPEGAVIRERTR